MWNVIVKNELPMILDCTNQHCCTNWTDSRKSLYWTQYVAMCWRNTVRLGSRVSVLISNTTRYWSSLCLITYNLRWGWAVCRQPSHLWNPRCHHTLSPTVPANTPPLDPPNCSFLLLAEYQRHCKLQMKWDRRCVDHDSIGITIPSVIPVDTHGYIVLN